MRAGEADTVTPLLTRRFDGPTVPVELGLYLARGGAVAALGSRWRWSASAPGVVEPVYWLSGNVTGLLV
ncbi:MAG: hypothetical protein H6746_01605 [Deltaproteobacteria bacterium]|nr:hypothetical protein [Deltaproteobacteria bacterium]